LPPVRRTIFFYFFYAKFPFFYAEFPLVGTGLKVNTLAGRVVSEANAECVLPIQGKPRRVLAIKAYAPKGPQRGPLRAFFLRP
jgi:hypothetical protein